MGKKNNAQHPAAKATAPATKPAPGPATPPAASAAASGEAPPPAKDQGEHNPKSIEWKNFKRNRHGRRHITLCEEGYRTKSLSQIHHLLCVHACSDVNVQTEDLQFTHDCLAAATWDINDELNTVGLPLKPAYVDELDHPELGRLPCHQVDHPDYLEDVERWVIAEIWNKLREAREEKKCADTEGGKIQQKLRDGSAYFLGELRLRGSRPKYAEGQSGPTGAAAMVKLNFAPENWWHPFSMSRTPRERPRPPTQWKTQLDLFLNLIK